MKTYVIILAENYPAGHQYAGESTYFKNKFLYGLGCPDCSYANATHPCPGKGRYACPRGSLKKLHTLRGNYEMWKKRFAEIETGRACLSVRVWSGRPYHSKQKELARLTKGDGIGLQRVRIYNVGDGARYAMLLNAAGDKVGRIETYKLANNDGLPLFAWEDWFRKANDPDFAVIQFTKFRY